MENTQSTKTRKIAAISAGALVVGLGLTYTLATWTDSEWVWGSADGNTGVSTSSFNVQQNTFDPDDWTDRETQAEAGALTFGIEALALSPGETVYAPMSLRTAIGSIGGNVQLAGAVDPEAPSNILWNAVELSVWTMPGGTGTPTCDDSTAGAAGAEGVVLESASLSTASVETQSLAASAEGEPGARQDYCFAITLPETAAGNSDLQGLQISPAWQFTAESQ